jgi:hypothetical protein
MAQGVNVTARIRAWVLLVLFLAGAAHANDGVDRYAGPEPVALYHLGAPPAGAPVLYTLLAHDGPGGADGEARFRWARDYALSLVVVALSHVHDTLGPAALPPVVFDLSAENADTPVDFSGTAPAGRHPGGSHDGGVNLDLGYYLTSTEGRRFSPDYAACSEHAVDGADVFRCTGPADRLDVNRQAMFLIEVFKLHQGLFLGELVREVGVDARVADAVLERARGWARDGLHGVTDGLVDDLASRLTSDPFDGWERHHHHHLHLRLAVLDPYGPRRLAQHALHELEVRALEGRGDEPNRVLVRLGVLGLDRFAEVLISRPSPTLAKVLVSADAKTWVEAVPGERFRAQVDLGRSGLAPDGRASQALLYVQLRYRDGREQIETRALPLPPGHPALAVQVRAEAFAVRRVREAGGLWLEVEFPAVFDALVTGLAFAPGPSERPRPIDAASRRLRLDGEGEISGDLLVTLSGRFVLRIPMRLR